MTKKIMPTSLTCPFCNSKVPIIGSTFRTEECFFNNGYPHTVNENPTNRNIFNIEMLHCPECDEVSFLAVGKENFEGKIFFLYPSSRAKQFPDYIPSFIKQDYEEAYSIADLSPKASATLSRRCLQAMIRDFWGISKKTLYDEVEAIKTKVSLSQWNAIDAIRSIGNIGAHMTKDVNAIVDIEPNEAIQLLKLIELLIDKWYIARHDEEELLKSIVKIKDNKQNQKVTS